MPGPGYRPPGDQDDPGNRTLAVRHTLLAPIP